MLRHDSLRSGRISERSIRSTTARCPGRTDGCPERQLSAVYVSGEPRPTRALVKLVRTANGRRTRIAERYRARRTDPGSGTHGRPEQLRTALPGLGRIRLGESNRQICAPKRGCERGPPPAPSDLTRCGRAAVAETEYEVPFGAVRGSDRYDARSGDRRPGSHRAKVTVQHRLLACPDPFATVQRRHRCERAITCWSSSLTSGRRTVTSRVWWKLAMLAGDGVPSSYAATAGRAA